MPTLNVNYTHVTSDPNARVKTTREKQMEIVEYLKMIAPRDLMASFVGIDKNHRMHIPFPIQHYSHHITTILTYIHAQISNASYAST